MQDIIGPREWWPSDVRRFMWRVTPRGNDFLRNKERFRLALFCYINEVPLPLLMSWCQAVKLLRGVKAIKHVRELYKRFKQDEVRGVNRYSSWNVRLGVDLYVTGKNHYYPKKGVVSKVNFYGFSVPIK